MRSKGVQRLLDEYNSKPFWYRFKIDLKNELYVIKRLGLLKYIKTKTKRYGKK